MEEDEEAEEGMPAVMDRCGSVTHWGHWGVTDGMGGGGGGGGGGEG